MTTIANTKGQRALDQVLRYVVSTLTDCRPSIADGVVTHNDGTIYKLDWPPCRWQALQISWDGHLQIVGQCQNPLCEKHLQSVDPATCRLCPCK